MKVLGSGIVACGVCSGLAAAFGGSFDAVAALAAAAWLAEAGRRLRKRVRFQPLGGTGLRLTAGISAMWAGACIWTALLGSTGEAAAFGSGAALLAGWCAGSWRERYRDEGIRLAWTAKETAALENGTDLRDHFAVMPETRHEGKYR